MSEVFKPLQEGDVIGVCAPGSYIKKDKLNEGISYLEKQGFQVEVHPQTYERLHQSAGTHQQKLQALQHLYEHPQIKAIYAAGGGNRVLHLLTQLDFDKLKENPKPLIGFSDITSLLNSLSVRTGHAQVHAPVLKHLNGHSSAESLMQLLKTGMFDYPTLNATSLCHGTASGKLFGGNLTVLHHMIGTEFFPDLDGAILMIEDTHEETSRLDRTLCHFRQLGLFDRLGGLILGEFTNLQDTGAHPFGFSFEEIVREHTSHLNIPIIMNAPFGHGDQNLALPIGADVTLKVTEDQISLSSN